MRDRHRTNQLKVDLSDSDKAKLLALAEANEQTVSAFIRGFIRARYAQAVNDGRVIRIQPQ